jgi:hypothetical protein
MPVIAVAAIPTVASFLLRMGITKAAKKYAPKLIKQARAYIKKNNLTKAKPTVGAKSTKKITVTKSKRVRPVNKKTQTKKTDKKTETTTQKPDKSFFDKAGIKKPVGGSTAVVKYNPRQIAIIKAKPKGKLTAADKALLAAISAGTLATTGGTKKTETKKTGRTDSPSSFIASKTKGVTMDDMLVKKDVKGRSPKFLEKGSKGRGQGQFGSNISFTSKDVKTLKKNASDLKKQINQLDITNMQKLRLKKLIDTRDPGYSMGESYNRAFKEVKKRVKDNKLNFAIDVSGYAG